MNKQTNKTYINTYIHRIKKNKIKPSRHGQQANTHGKQVNTHGKLATLGTQAEDSNKLNDEI